MATFVLIHGAGDVGWYWHLTEAELQARDHHTIAPDLPCDNDTASHDDYAGTAIDAASGQENLVIVGQSYGAFSATPAASPAFRAAARAARRNDPVPWRKPRRLVDQHRLSGSVEQQARLDGGKAGHDNPLISFYNGMPRPLAEQALHKGGRGESSTVWNTPWPLDGWPNVPTKFILCKDDRFFPAAYLRRLAQQRLGIMPDEVPGCHGAALSHPKANTTPALTSTAPARWLTTSSAAPAPATIAPASNRCHGRAFISRVRSGAV
jgi:hypothetical protein